MNEDELKCMTAFLLDLDGTIYLGPNALPGAVEFIQFIKDSGRKHLFFTNNSSANATQYSTKLSRMGIPAAPTDILTSGEATIRYLLTETSYRRLYVLGTPSFEQEVREAGLELTEKDPDAVVLAFDRTLTYTKLEKACLFLRADLPYFATNPDKVCPTEYGYIPDCASMAALLFTSTGKTPRYIGKPNPEMIHMGLQKIGADPSHTAMVGDRLYTDMQMAYNAGITSILVLSGETTKNDLRTAERMPDYILDSVQELHQKMRV